MHPSKRIRQVIGAAIGAAIAAAVSTGLAMPAAERHERIFGAHETSVAAPVTP